MKNIIKYKIITIMIIRLRITSILHLVFVEKKHIYTFF